MRVEFGEWFSLWSGVFGLVSPSFSCSFGKFDSNSSFQKLSHGFDLLGV